MIENQIDFSEMATKCHISRKDLYELLGGDLPICGEYAVRLEKAGFGTEAFWNARQARYDQFMEKERKNGNSS